MSPLALPLCFFLAFFSSWAGVGRVGCRATCASSIAVQMRGMIELRSRVASLVRVLELDKQLGTMRADTAPVALIFMSVGLGTWCVGEGPGEGDAQRTQHQDRDVGCMCFCVRGLG